MKDAKGHGSDARGGAAHQAGVNDLGHGGLHVWFHGSPVGEPGPGPIHVGTVAAARIALEARIGIPADGKGWDGTREYGKTLLAGQDTLDRMNREGYVQGHYNTTGYNAGSAHEDIPKHDYYPSERAERADMGPTRTPVPLTAKPSVAAYQITGSMLNSPDRPYADAKANSLAKRITRGGLYYKNEGEDSGSISAVVPGKSFLRRV